MQASKKPHLARRVLGKTDTPPGRIVEVVNFNWVETHSERTLINNSPSWAECDQSTKNYFLSCYVQAHASTRKRDHISLFRT